MEKAVAVWRELSLLRRRRPRRARGAMEREEGGRSFSGTEEMLAVEPPAVVENDEAARQPMVRCDCSSCGDLFRRMETTCYG